MLDDLKLSDLFFNYEHPEWDTMCGNPEADWADRTIAIRQDGLNFANFYPEFDKSGEWYAEDFLRRV